MATRKRHTPEQVVRKLTQADRMLAEGKEIADVCRELQVSEKKCRALLEEICDPIPAAVETLIGELLPTGV